MPYETVDGYGDLALILVSRQKLGRPLRFYPDVCPDFEWQDIVRDAPSVLA
jgi:hypothetical protein